MVNHDKAEVADVLVQDGKIVAVGQDLELPQVCSVMFVLVRSPDPLADGSGSGERRG